MIRVGDYKYLLLELTHPVVGFTHSLKCASVNEELNLMKNMNRMGKPVNLLAVLAIATTGIIAPAIAGTNIASSGGSLKLAQLSPNPTPATTPSPTSSPTTAPSPRSSPTTAPTTAPSPRSSPTTAPTTAPSPRSSPTTAPTTAPSPRSSPTTAPTTAPSPTTSPEPTPSPTTSPATPTNQSLCRRVIKPQQGLVIRREPTTQAPVVGGVAYQGRVTLTANPPTTRTVDNRDWVEISSPARGWISHSLTTETVSNLAYCR